MKISSMQGRIESLLPPNVDPGSTLSSLNGAFIGGLTGSMLWFVTKYSRDYQALFTYDSVLRKKTLVAGARIAPFTDYEGCALWLLLPRGGTTDCTAEIWIDGKMVRSIYLPQAQDEDIPLTAYGKQVLLRVKNHRIAFITSDCPDHVCIKNGWLAREGEQAICLPNRVSVILTDGSTVPVELD